MDLDTVMGLIGRWGGTLKFFPSDPDARIGIAEEIAGMAYDEDQVRWLVSGMPKLYTEWPGMLEVRAVFCTKYKPRDGVEAALGTGSPAFGALCGDEVKALAAPAPLQIAGDVLTDDPEMLALTQKVAERAPRMVPDSRVETAIQPGETELQALTRSVRDFNADRWAEQNRTPTEAEIAMLVQLQNAARTESKTT